MTRSKRVPLPSLPRSQEKQKPLHHTDRKPSTEEAPQPRKRKTRKTKAITSCERCRHAHIKCVGNGAGEPCENCAKRGIQTCSHVYSNRDPDADSNLKLGNASNLDTGVRPNHDSVVKPSYSLSDNSSDDRVADTIVVKTVTNSYSTQNQQLQILAASALAYMEENLT